MCLMKKIELQDGDSRLAKLLESIGLIKTTQSITWEPVERNEIKGVRVEFEFVAGQTLVAKFIFDDTEEGKAALKLYRDKLALESLRESVNATLIKNGIDEFYFWVGVDELTEDTMSFEDAIKFKLSELGIQYLAIVDET